MLLFSCHLYQKLIYSYAIKKSILHNNTIALLHIVNVGEYKFHDCTIFHFTALEWASTDSVPVFRAGFASKSSQTIYIMQEMTFKNILMSTFRVVS